MPLDSGAVKAPVLSKEEKFKSHIENLNTIDFDHIVRYLMRGDACGWDENKALSELGNFKVFFSLPGIADFPIVPTKAIDEVWHACILHTGFYRKLCKQIHGRFVDHNPSDGTPEAKDRDKSHFVKTGDLFHELTGRFYGQRCTDHMDPMTNCSGCTCDTCSYSSCEDDFVGNASLVADCSVCRSPVVRS